MAGLYLHIPFCVKKCAYCDFLSFPEDGRLSAYVEALCGEIRLASGREDMPQAFDTVFLGGGTPSLLSADQMGRILHTIRECFTLADGAEISLECNPGTAGGDRLKAYFDAGCNRISIGVQSTDDALNASIGRIHTAAQARDAVRLARDAGFQNINVDLMHGLPGQTQGAYLRSLKDAADLGVEHISAYALILEAHTPLYEAARRGETVLPDPDETADMEDAGMEYLNSRGYLRYEISNFAQPGHECRHNLNYWDNGEYLGLGLGAHSAFRRKYWTRWANTESLESYISQLNRGKLPVNETLRLYQADEMFETVMLGLRKTAGLDKSGFMARFGLPLEEAYPKAVGELRKRGWLTEAEGRFALNSRGLDLQNEALELFM